jgi:hypothetical protein
LVIIYFNGCFSIGRDFDGFNVLFGEEKFETIVLFGEKKFETIVKFKQLADNPDSVFLWQCYSKHCMNYVPFV